MIKKLNDNGSTLVECIVAFALFSLSAIILLSGFLTAANLVVKSTEVKNNSNNNIMGIESANTPTGVTVTESAQQTISFTLGSVSYSAKGTYKTSQSGNLKLTEFISSKSDNTNNFIPDTDKPVNGQWPSPAMFPETWSYVTVPKWTTIVYDGVYYIAAQDLNIGPGSPYPTPTKGGWDWLGSNNNLVQISSRAVIQWNGGTQTDFYNTTGGKIDKGDKVYWNGNYYVFTISNQTWAEPPNVSLSNWVLIKYPF